MIQQNKPLLGSRIDPEHPLSRGLVGCWLFNENSGNRIYDLSMNGNDGIFGNDPAWAPGRTGQAIDFDGGDDYIDIDNSDSLDFGSNSFTLSAWAKKQQNGTVMMIISKGTDFRYRFGYFSTNKVHFEIDDNIGARSIFSDKIITDSQWHHLVAIRDDPKNQLELYIGGNLDKVFFADVGNISNGLSLYIGQDRRIADQYFNGLIDFPCIWNRALSAQEVQDLYINPYGMIWEPKVFYIPNDPVRKFTAENVDTHFIAENIDTHLIAESRETHFIAEPS